MCTFSSRGTNTVMSRVLALQPPVAEPVHPVAHVVSRAGVRPDAAEAAALFEAWSPRVRGYIAFRVRDPDDADDLVGEVFRRVVSGPIPSDPAGRPAWIFRVAHNAVVDHYRRRRFPLVPAFLDRPDDAPSLPDTMIKDERMRATDAALRLLPSRQRAAIYLRFYEDMAYESVAAVMGVPAATARSLVHRGLKRLAAALGEEAER
jgi:RNA polymerase sigma factor (sigma-70 family)